MKLRERTAQPGGNESTASEHHRYYAVVTIRIIGAAYAVVLLIFLAAWST